MNISEKKKMSMINKKDGLFILVNVLMNFMNVFLLLVKIFVLFNFKK